MFSLTLILSLGALAPPASGGLFNAPIELEKPKVAAARVAGCGFKRVRPKFDDDLQEDVLEVQGVTFASEEQLRCAAQTSLQSHYYVTFPAPVEQAYQSLYWRMSRESDKADASAWLEKRGLLSRLSTYDPKRSDEIIFIRTLEMLCGPKAAGTLKPMGGMATFGDGALGTLKKGGFSSGKLDDETLLCLMKVASASGYSLGFIGNEYQEKP